jgi:hypothetical protein
MAGHNIVRGFDDRRSCSRKPRDKQASAAHDPAKWIQFADKGMRQHENLRRFPVILDHLVIQYDREALQARKHSHSNSGNRIQDDRRHSRHSHGRALTEFASGNHEGAICLKPS